MQHRGIRRSRKTVLPFISGMIRFVLDSCMSLSDSCNNSGLSVLIGALLREYFMSTDRGI